MRDVTDILQECFINLQLTEDVTKVNVKEVLTSPLVAAKYIECWEVKPLISAHGVAKRITLYMCFDSSFPYSWPDIYIIDKQYDYLAHIGYDDRKLCLFPDETIAKPQSPEEMIVCSLKTACQLLKENIDGVLNDDFKQEILSYWRYTYDKESYIGTGYILSRSTLSEDVQLKARFAKNDLFIFDEADTTAIRILKNCCGEPEGRIYDVMFVSKYIVPDRPPYRSEYQ